MSSPPLTVLMPVYNAEGYLEQAIDSVLAQTFSDFSFIIVDDGSTDGSSAILAEYAARDRRIVALSKANSGITSTLNFGLSHTNATFLARMDADDISLPHRFARQMEVLADNPQLAVVGSKVVAIDRKGAIRHARPALTGPQAIAAALPTRNCISHPSTMMRLSALVAVGGYREKYRNSQDYDLWLRLSENQRLDNIDEILLRYRTHGGRSSAATNRGRQTVYSVCAATDFFCRRYGLPTSDDPIDLKEPAYVVDRLKVLLALDRAEDDRPALYRHSLRLIRYGGAGKAVSELAGFMRRILAGRREYRQLAKLITYWVA